MAGVGDAGAYPRYGQVKVVYTLDPSRVHCRADRNKHPFTFYKFYSKNVKEVNGTNHRQQSAEKSLWLNKHYKTKTNTQETFLKLYIQDTTGNCVAQVKKIKTINFHIVL